MDTNEFIYAVHSFAEEIAALLETTLEGETKLEMLPPNWEKKKRRSPFKNRWLSENPHRHDCTCGVNTGYAQIRLVTTLLLNRAPSKLSSRR